MADVVFREFEDIKAELRTLDPRRDGMHFGMLAPTRNGKTTMYVKGLADLYPATLILDSTADPNPPLVDFGKPLKKWGKIEGVRKVSVEDTSNESKMKLYNAMMKAFKQGDVMIYCDEIRHLADPKFFGLQKALEHIWLFGAKRGVSIGGGSQAPRWLPSAFYDQSRFHFLGNIRDKRAMQRVAEIGGDTDTLRHVLPELPKYHWAYVSPDGDISITTLRLTSPEKSATVRVNRESPSEKRIKLRK